MATNRKRLQVYLTDDQYEAFKQIAAQVGAQSASQLAAEILIRECKLAGEAPERGRYYRAVYEMNEDGTPTPDYHRVEITIAEEAAYAQEAETLKRDLEDFMPDGVLARIKARKV